MPPKSSMDAAIQIRVPKDIMSKLDSLAKPRLLSRSDIVREAIMAYLDGRKK